MGVKKFHFCTDGFVPNMHLIIFITLISLYLRLEVFRIGHFNGFRCKLMIEEEQRALTKGRRQEVYCYRIFVSNFCNDRH